MKEHLSLVELATYGYSPTRVRKGSWLEQTFGRKNEVEEDERIKRPDQNKNKQKGRRSDQDA